MNCPTCNADLGNPTPSFCPGCFSTIASRAAVPPEPVVAPISGRPPREFEPAPSSTLQATTACATDGCTGLPPRGQRFCVTCALINDQCIPAHRLTGRWGDIDIPSGGSVVVGRSPQDAPLTAAMLAAADRVSRVHAVIAHNGQAVTLVDQSTNGTTVNSKTLQVGIEQVLLPGDRVVFGMQAEFEVREA